MKAQFTGFGIDLGFEGGITPWFRFQGKDIKITKVDKIYAAAWTVAFIMIALVRVI